MQKWEYTRIYIVITPDFGFMTKVGSEILAGEKVWEYINSLGQEGWEMVNVVERIGNEPQLEGVAQRVGNLFNAMMVGPTLTLGTQHKAVTLGYFYHFKRESLGKPQPIEQLKELRDKGILTEDEFQKKKEELLNRM
jgi:hypothetical protein